jgi:Ca-activated chloride channel family protein
MRVRPILALSLVAVTLTSAAPPPAPAEPQLRSDRFDPSPVRCRVGREDRDIAVTGGRVRKSMGNAYMPAPPPPPPPPPPMVSMEARIAPPGIVAPSPIMQSPVHRDENRERYDGREVASIQSVADQPVSTFSVDVDTGSYANVRRFLAGGKLPPADAVRTEEMLKYFRYDYPRPADRAQPFNVALQTARTPWNADTRLLRIGLRGYDVTGDTRPAANLVFLVDVSGSMSSDDKLPLVKSALMALAGKLTPRDRVSIVVYAGAAGVVLEPTANKAYVKQALDCLEAGGSTAGGDGIKLAYATARANFREGGINRIFVATDGDFNVGVTDNKALEDMVKRNRDDGITLTTLGFGTGNYNEALMERIADVGNGNYAYIDSAMEAQKVLDDELSATLVTIAKDVKIQVEFNPAMVSEYRLIGYENRALAEEDFANDAVDAGDVGAGHQVTALYELVPTGGKGWLAERRYADNRRPAPDARTGELGIVKLRYKMPDGTTSRLIEIPVQGAMLRTAAPPSGDMAFAAAVAAFGQKLRGDKYLNGFSYADIRTLAGDPQGYWRQEFVKLARLAESQSQPTRLGATD